MVVLALDLLCKWSVRGGSVGQVLIYFVRGFRIVKHAV